MEDYADKSYVNNVFGEAYSHEVRNIKTIIHYILV